MATEIGRCKSELVLVQHQRLRDFPESRFGRFILQMFKFSVCSSTILEARKSNSAREVVTVTSDANEMMCTFPYCNIFRCLLVRTVPIDSKIKKCFVQFSQNRTNVERHFAKQHYTCKSKCLANLLKFCHIWHGNASYLKVLFNIELSHRRTVLRSATACVIFVLAMFLLLLILVYFASTSSANSVSCKDERGNSVDW